MLPLVRRLPLDGIVPAVLAVTIVVFAAGSSSVAVVNDVGKPLRWALLLVLLLVAAAWAATRRDVELPSRRAVTAAACFAAFALLSALWSVDALLTAGRALSLAVLFAVAALLARASAGRPDARERLLAGVLAGAAVVALAGLLVLGVDHAAAVQEATYDVPLRYQGLGENPNTVALLLALALPVALWLALAPRSSRPVRVLAVALFLLFDASIVASGSRGALVAGFGSLLVLVLLAPVRLSTRALLLVVVAGLFGASVAAGEIAKPTGVPPKPPAGAAAPGRYVDVEKDLPLSFDIGTSPTGVPGHGHELLGSSGRAVAWRGALDTAQERPTVGYGFGTEAKVFVDRYALFQGGVPENSYIGLDLQLGAVGLALFTLLVATLAVSGFRGRREPGVVVCLSVLAAGLLLAVGQSYLYSVGNIGTVTLWVCAFAGAAAVAEPRTRP